MEHISETVRMRMLFFTLGNELVPSSRTRVFQYLPHLNKLGVDADVIKYETSLDYALHAKFQPKNPYQKSIFLLARVIIKLLDVLFGNLSITRLLLAARSHDVVFVQKVLLPVIVQKTLTKLNDNIVFDFDDAIYANKSHSQERLNHFLSQAKLAVIENEETRSYVKKFGVTPLIITGPIDCDRYKPAKSKEKNQEIVIGWIGSSTTTEYLSLLAKPLQELSSKYPHVVLELIGSAHIDLKGVRMKRYPWSLDTETTLLSRFDIGVMPMPDDEWTRGKGGYKLLQYMAMGIPAVCSPVGVNTEIVLHGETGYLAETEEEWFLYLEKLITEEQSRSSMGQNGRLRVQSEYSFERNTPKLLEAIRSVIDSG
jgi:glycosyltransferase involved in cell wall biosynthesis